MNIVIRGDSSIYLGIGHIQRCLTLADALYKRNANVCFICRELPGNACAEIERRGFEVFRLPYDSLVGDDKHSQYKRLLGADLETDANQIKAVLMGLNQKVDWLIVDHYALDKSWETQLRAYVDKIMVIDDLVDQPHDCDLLLNQNLHNNLEARYEGLLPDHCQKLLGPEFAMLRPEFRETRKNLRDRDGSINRIMIFFGGGDPNKETVKALEAIRLLNRPDIVVDVVVGSANPYTEEIKQVCNKLPNARFYSQVDNMAQLMADADLAIGAGGSTTWERCFLGLPSITLVIAQNQLEASRNVAALGATWNLGWGSDISVEELAIAIRRAVDNPNDVKKMGLAATQIMGASLLEEELQVVKIILEDDYAATKRL